LELSADSFTIQGNTIGLEESSTGYGMYLEGGGFTVENNALSIDLLGSSSAAGTGIYVDESSDTQSTTAIRDNTIEFLGSHKSQDDTGVEVIYSRTDALAEVLIERNNIALKPTGGGVAFELFANQHADFTAQNNIVRDLGWKGVRLRNVADANHFGIYNNSFSIASTTSSNATVAVSVADYDTATGALPIELVNNIFDGSAATTTAVEFFNGVQGASIDSDYNLWFQFETMYLNGSSSTGANEISAQDPGFQNDLLEVPSTSPAVDAGAEPSLYPGLPGVDYMGSARPAGAGYDMGAHEQ
ncbi:MAG: choice-of-anchor Q domain-containing protein, partial [Persicimonas sp.]